MTRPRRLGLFGGSFDPIHRGHLHAARVAQNAFELDRVVFVPAARSPHKLGDGPAPATDRLAMVHSAIRGRPGWTVSELELDRAGPSYTIDTVRELAAAVGEPRDAEIWMILGTDNLPALPTWRAAVELLLRVQPVIVLREGDPEQLPRELVDALPEDVVRRLERGFLRLPPAPGRSTDLRAALARGERGLPELPPAVEEYIRSRGLYRVV